MRAAFFHNFGGHTGRETPLPIPNREVKPARADGTRRATSRESRSPPIYLAKPAPLAWASVVLCVAGASASVRLRAASRARQGRARAGAAPARRQVGAS